MSSTNGWKSYVVPLILAGMILILVYVGVVFVTTLRQSRASLPTVQMLETRVAGHDARLTTRDVQTQNEAKSAAETVEALAVDVQTLDARAQGLDARAGTAEAQLGKVTEKLSTVEATSTETPVTETVTPTMRAIDGGMGLAYRIAGRTGTAFYRVDELLVYRTFDEFKAEWESEQRMDGPAVVQLALIHTGDDPGAWTLYHRPFAQAEVQPAQWYFYTLFAGEDVALGTTSAALEWGPPATISASTPFTVGLGVTTFHSLRALQREGIPIDQDKSHLLLADGSSGTPAYTLVILDDTDSGGWDPARFFCSNCLRCSWICG